MNINSMMDEFILVFDITKTPITSRMCHSTLKLISEEVAEFEAEFSKDTGCGDKLDVSEINQEYVAKELTDILYVTAQRMRQMGMDVNGLLQAVHTSNMSKTVEVDALLDELAAARLRYPTVKSYNVRGSTFVLRDQLTGKVIKPVGYISAILPEELYLR